MSRFRHINPSRPPSFVSKLVFQNVFPAASLIQYDLMMINASDRAVNLYSEYIRNAAIIEQKLDNLVRDYAYTSISDTDIDQIRNKTIDWANQKIRDLAKVNEYVGNKGLGYYLKGPDGQNYFHEASPDELRQIAKGQMPEGEMHHESSLQNLYNDSSPESIRRVADPDNINRYARDAHLSQHDGNWRNPTNDVNNKLSAADKRTEDNVQSGDATEPGFSHFDEAIYLFFGYLTVSMIVKTYLHKKQGIKVNKTQFLSDLGSSSTDAAMAAGAYLVASFARDQIGSLDLVNNLDALSSLDELLGSAAGFTAIAALHGAITSSRAGYSGQVVLSETISTLKSSAVKSGVFVVGGVLLDCFTPLGDPTISLIATGTRIAWTLGSMCYRYIENKETTLEISKLRYDYYYNKALGQIG